MICFASKAHNLITIQNMIESNDDYGGQSILWTSLYSCFSIIEQAGGNEVFANEILQSKTTHTITIRFIDELKNTKDIAKYRINYEDRYFSILYIVNFSKDLSREGRFYQKLYVQENEAEYQNG